MNTNNYEEIATNAKMQAEGSVELLNNAKGASQTSPDPKVKNTAKLPSDDVTLSKRLCLLGSVGSDADDQGELGGVSEAARGGEGVSR